MSYLAKYLMGLLDALVRAAKETNNELRVAFILTESISTLPNGVKSDQAAAAYGLLGLRQR